MNLYYITADLHGYDVYYGAIVAAETKEDAANMHPSNGEALTDSYNSGWVETINEVTVELIGVAIEGTEKGVILSDFHAG